MDADELICRGRFAPKKSVNSVVGKGDQLNRSLQSSLRERENKLSGR